MSERGIFGLKPDLRLEWRGQGGQNETQKPDHSSSLGDSITSSTRIAFSVHTRNEKEKLTALLHHVSIDVLRWAFFNIKKQAAPGVAERMCKQVSVSLPYRGDSHDEQLYD